MDARIIVLFWENAFRILCGGLFYTRKNKHEEKKMRVLVFGIDLTATMVNSTQACHGHKGGQA